MNLYEFVAQETERETILYEDETIRIVTINSSHHTTPIDAPYDQEEDEWVSILEGEAELKVENTIIPLHKGDHYMIKAHQKHWVTYTSNRCIWLCVFEKKC